MRTYKDYKEALFSISFTLHNRVKPMYLRHVEDKWLDVIQELVDKATPKKPIAEYVVDGRYCVCPECGALLDEECLLKTYKCLREGHQYCHVCGQAIDWSEEDGSSD